MSKESVSRTSKKRRKTGKRAAVHKKVRRSGGADLAFRIVSRALLFIFVILVALIIGLYAVLNEVFHGPSPAASDRLVMSLYETSALKFVPTLFFSDEEYAAIRERNKIQEITERTDTSLIVFTPPSEQESALTADDGGPQVVDGMILEEIRGATYQGWLLTVLDPSRVILGVSTTYFRDDVGGMRIDQIAEKYGAVAAINGGAFADSNGQGNGGVAIGVTVSEGEVLNAYGAGDLTTAAFDQNNVLIVGKMSRQEARDLNIRDACSFGPALVVNGVGAEVTGGASGLNPRTAIGQRADGAVLMLVIDGRQVNSLGASLADLVEIMLNHGAVNACNLDGGSSSNLVYHGEVVNTGAPITGARRIPTAFVVR